MRSRQYRGHRVQSPGSANDNLARTTGHVVSLPPPYIIYLGAVLNTKGEGHLSPHLTSPTVAVPTSRSIVKEVLAERKSANDKEADGRTRALPPTDMTAKVIGKDTQRPVIDDATPRRVVAECITSRGCGRLRTTPPRLRN